MRSTKGSSTLTQELQKVRQRVIMPCSGTIVRGLSNSIWVGAQQWARACCNVSQPRKTPTQTNN